MAITIEEMIQRTTFTGAAILYRHEAINVCLFPMERCREIGFSASDAGGVSTGSVARSDDPQEVIGLFAALAGNADPSGEHAAPCLVSEGNGRVLEWINRAIASL